MFLHISFVEILLSFSRTRTGKPQNSSTTPFQERMSHSAQKFLGCLQRSSGLGWNGLFGLFIGHENTESDAHLHKPSQFWCEMLESLVGLSAF